MLHELVIKNLGVIDEASVLLGPGMTAVTGETGAGKTIIVGAIGLLVGARADGTAVRAGCDEATVEGRFVTGDEELVLRRVVPRDGRSRAYVNGSLATVGELAELGGVLVDLHGQHTHQSLLRGSAQRESLDRFGKIDLTVLRAAEAELARIDAELAALGGDERARAREIDLCRYQRDEIEAAAIEGPDEDERLAWLESMLADAGAHLEAGAGALSIVDGDGPVVEQLGAALSAIEPRAPFAEQAERLRSVLAELTDIASSVRDVVDTVEDDPARLEEVQARRAQLRDLRRKYGDRLEDVLTFHAETAARLAELESYDRRAAELDDARHEAARARTEARAEVRRQRLEVAPELAAAVTVHLADLAMPHAALEIAVDGDAGEDVAFLLRANPGAEALPLAKTASGGELARVMLALRVVTTHAPPTLVFDEVDAGIGGEVAHAVGRALRALGDDHQVLVVTHLAQVAAVADHQALVTKVDHADHVATTVDVLDADRRVVEISRMLSGTPGSDAAREHAIELLANAGGAPD